MNNGALPLLALLQPSSIDARRGVVRLRAEVLAALGAQAFDPLELVGKRRTGALAGIASPDSDLRVLYADELVLANLDIVSQTQIQVRRAIVRPALSLTVSGPPEVTAAVGPEVVRLALLGKVVTAGDQVSLLPQDVSLHDGATTKMLDLARLELRQQVGPQWTGLLLRIDEGPEDPSIVSMSTVVVWSDGRQTQSSATPPMMPRRMPPTRSAPPVMPGPARSVPASGSIPMPDILQPSAGPVWPGAPGWPGGPGAPAAPVLPRPSPHEALPGLERQSAALSEWWELGFHRSDLLRQLGTTPAMGVLVSGPAGSGKVSLIRGVAESLGATVVHVWGPALAALELNGAAGKLRAAIEQAGSRPPAVLLVEDVDALAPREQTGPLASLLLEEVTGLIREGRVAVACTTARPETVSPELRRPGALDHELAVPLPDRAQRRALLDVLCRPLPLGNDVALDDVAARTPGFVAADLQALGREAATRAAQRLAGPPVAGQPVATPTVERADFEAALEVVRPSSMATSTLDVGRVTLDQVGDMTEVKAALTEAVLWPLSYPDTFARMGISPPRGVLLYGPPGCGKTFLVKAVAAAGETNVLSVKGAELLSRYVGDSEAGVRDLFQRAREAAPTLIFLDEVDALAPVRGQSMDSGVTDRVVAALLTELDGVEDLRDVVVIGATNRPDMIDPALLRPGRLERLVYVPPPDAAARAAILRAASARVPLDPAVSLEALAEELELWSSADLAALVRESAMTAMRRSLSAPMVTAEDVAAARRAVHPSLRADQVASLAAYAQARTR